MIEYVNTVNEALRATAIVSRNRWRVIYVIYAVLGLVILTFSVSYAPQTQHVHVDGWRLGFGLLLLTMPLWRRPLSRFLIARQHAKLATANKPVRWTITADPST